MGTVTSVMGSELGNWVVMSVKSVDEEVVGGWRWLKVVSVRLGWTSSFPVITRIQYDGFLWGFGVVTPDEDKVTRTRILECSREGGY